MNRNQEIQCFLLRFRNTYNSLESWFDKQILFACSTGFCGVYYKLGISFKEEQIFNLATRVMRYYLNALYQNTYFQMFDICTINLAMFQDLIPEEFWLGEADANLPLGEISGLQLELLIEWSLEEVVLDHIFSSMATFQTTVANTKNILC